MYKTGMITIFQDSILNFEEVIRIIHNRESNLLYNTSNLQIIMVQIQLMHYLRTGNNIYTTRLVNLKTY
jgi:hypothetical protein